MGVLYSGQNKDASHPVIFLGSRLDRRSNTPTMGDPWMIAIVVIGSLIIITLVVFILAYYIRSRRRRGKEFQPVESLASPYLGATKLSADDRRKAEDLERDTIIWKSLATRPSSTVSTHGSQGLATPDQSSHSEEERPEEERPEDQGETAGLKEDWKAWEAREMSDRRRSSPRGMGLDQHPAFASHLSGTATNPYASI
ncbi:hypothetical protein F4861DRAFT_501210 [Xylaria intraflava]|nr:hypothetical protein F4861DRAFT_501210 [Xylaria intraflava]